MVDYGGDCCDTVVRGREGGGGHTCTRTSPAAGVGFGASPMYRFSAGPLPSLMSTARIFGCMVGEEWDFGEMEVENKEQWLPSDTSRLSSGPKLRQASSSYPLVIGGSGFLIVEHSGLEGSSTPTM